MSFGRVARISVFRQPTAEDAFFEEIGTGIAITDLRVQFSIEKSLGKDPNTCKVVISNLAESTRTAFQKRPLRVHVEAGYESDGGPRLLFTGDVRPGSGSRINGTDWETKLLLGDGARAFSQARVNRSYKAGTPVKTVLRDAARSLGLVLPKEVEASPAVQSALATGEAVVGYASDELTRLLAPFGYSWSIQNGRLQILRDEEVRPEIFVLEETGGLLEVPELGPPDNDGKPPKLTVKHQLYPELLPGSTIEVRSRSVKGRFKIERVKHEGDTDGDQWETEVEARPL